MAGEADAVLIDRRAYRTDGELMLTNGVTRATRIAKLSPGTVIPVDVIGDMNIPAGMTPTIGDLLP